MKNIIIVLLMIAFTGGGFFAGVKYQQSKQPSRANFQAIRGMGQGTQGIQRPAGSEAVRGEIISQDGKSITVKLSDGSSRIVFVGDAVQINKSAPGTKDDLIKETQVFVIGSENPDGSITASSIQIGKLGGQ